ncbi:MAG: hypothetical protein Q9191_000470 [Dirinaria sp. TL-2023a]
MLGFSDVPFDIPPNAPSFYGCVEAKYVTKYLEDYIDDHVYCGKSLRERIFFGHQVEKVEKFHDTWKVRTRDTRDGTRSFKASKIVVATGLTSSPQMPILPGDPELFKGRVYHHKRFGEVSRTLLRMEGCHNVVVLGAGKSATDMVYESIKRRKNVSWIIRRDGEGPALYFPAQGGGRYENSTEAGATRWSALFSPSSFMPESWLSSLIHRTSVGVSYLTSRIEKGDQSCRDAAAYRDREGALPNFQNLEPTTSAFWCNGPLGLAQHDDFWNAIAQNVRVCRNDIKTIEAHDVVLDDGSRIEADVLLCGTGWNYDYPFFTKEQAQTFGLPQHPQNDLPEHTELWDTLLKNADRQVLSNFPILKSPPPHRRSEVPTTTNRLYNGIAPLGDTSIVFLGRSHLSNSFRTAEAQAIWATAYFDGNFKLPPLEEAQRQIAYMNALSRRRYPSRGIAGDYLFFELIWYTDKLLADVGLKSHRKGWWTDWLEPCLAIDLKDMPDEYRKKALS